MIRTNERSISLMRQALMHTAATVIPASTRATRKCERTCESRAWGGKEGHALFSRQLLATKFLAPAAPLDDVHGEDRKIVLSWWRCATREGSTREKGNDAMRVIASTHKSDCGAKAREQVERRRGRATPGCLGRQSCSRVRAAPPLRPTDARCRRLNG